MRRTTNAKGVPATRSRDIVRVALPAALMAAQVTGGGASASSSVPSLRVVAHVRGRTIGTAAAVTYTAVAAYGQRDVWVGTQAGFASGVLWSTDGGARWHDAATPHVVATDLTFVNARDGWLLGQPLGYHCPDGGCPDVLLATTDGGRHWTQTLSEAAASRGTALTGVLFTSRLRGYAVGGSVACGGMTPGMCDAGLFATTDGGRVWRRLAAGGLAPDSLSAAGGHVFASGLLCDPDGACRAAVDVIASGRAKLLSLVGPALRENPFVRVSFTDGADGWLLTPPAGGISDSNGFGSIYVTADGGRTWRREQDATFASGEPGAADGFPAGLAFATSRVGFIPVEAGAAQGVGGVEVTTDGGHIFRRVGAGSLWSISGLAPAGQASAWAVGTSKFGGPTFLVRVYDDGRWQSVLPAPAPTTAIAFGTGQEGVGVGTAASPDAVLTSDDGGRTWRRSGMLAGLLLATGAGMQGPRDAWVSGTTDVAEIGPRSWGLWRTTDGGTSWKRVYNGRDSLMGVRFFGSRVGYAATPGTMAGTAGARLLSTEDGGTTWQAVASLPAGQGLLAVSFVTPDVVYAETLSATGAVLWRSADRGQTWRSVGSLPAPPGTGLLYFTTPERGCVFTGGAAYVTDNGGRSWTVVQLPTAIVSSAVAALAPDGSLWLRAGEALYRTDNGGLMWRVLG